jgi:hypothetical protein
MTQCRGMRIWCSVRSILYGQETGSTVLRWKNSMSVRGLVKKKNKDGDLESSTRPRRRVECTMHEGAMLATSTRWRLQWNATNASAYHFMSRYLVVLEKSDMAIRIRYHLITRMNDECCRSLKAGYSVRHVRVLTKYVLIMVDWARCVLVQST